LPSEAKNAQGLEAIVAVVTRGSAEKCGVEMMGKNRIMIYGPKDDSTYVVEFRTAEGDVLAISIPRTEAAMVRHFQERMPYGLFVPDVDAAAL
jgi:hypothetical protein